MRMITLTVLAAAAGLAAAAPVDRADFSGDAVNIDFEGYADGVAITNQYDPLGVSFSGAEFDNSNTGFYGPLAMGNIAMTSVSLIGLDFTALGGTTDAVGADIVFRDNGGIATLTVFDSGGGVLGSVSTAPDTGIGDEVFLGFEAAGIASATFAFDLADTYAGIDHLVFEPVPAPGAAGVLGAGGLLLMRRRRVA